MKKEIVTKRIIQGLALCFGAVGAIWIYLGLHFLVSGLLKQDTTGAFFFIIPAFIILGGIAGAIAVQNIRSFGSDSIKSVLFAISFMIYGLISQSLFQYKDIDQPVTIMILISILPLVLTCFIYSVVSKKLICITGYEKNIPPKSVLEEHINNLDISDTSKKSIAEIMPWRKASRFLGYLLIAAGWFLVLSSIAGFIYFAAHGSDIVEPVLKSLGTFLFLGYILGRAGAVQLDKRNLANAIIEMMERKPEPPSEV